MKKLLRALFGSKDGSNTAQPTSELEQLAQSLELQYRRGKRSTPARMYGRINGFKVKVALYRSRWEIEVDYESGLQDFSLHQRSQNVKVLTNRETATMDDVELDGRYQLYTHNPEATAAFISWLTPTRRSVLFALDDAFIITDLEDDELEVRLRSDSPTTDELREAIAMCVWAAEAFDKSAPASSGLQDS